MTKMDKFKWAMELTHGWFHQEGTPNDTYNLGLRSLYDWGILIWLSKWKTRITGLREKFYESIYDDLLKRMRQTEEELELLKTEKDTLKRQVNDAL